IDRLTCMLGVQITSPDTVSTHIAFRQARLSRAQRYFRSPVSKASHAVADVVSMIGGPPQSRDERSKTDHAIVVVLAAMHTQRHGADPAVAVVTYPGGEPTL
ncbi:MAG: hypothetical protein ACXVIH_14585, partial [Ilumatobacteraceae bacterium]